MVNFIKKELLKRTFFRKMLNQYFSRVKKVYTNNYTLFKDKNGVEIGGPSQVFSQDGSFPVYTIINSLDNINFSDDNFWSSLKEGNNFEYQKGKTKGKQIIADAIDLSKIKSESYDFMLSSHVIEHIANPIKAVLEWKRVLKKDGIVVVVAPDMRHTYDRKRPLTEFDHVKQDFLNEMDEEDDTHFDEVVKLHDLSNDSTVKSYDEHVKRTLDNKNTRIVHHHTFDIDLVKKILRYCDFEVIDSEAFRPFHLLVIARKKQ